MKYTFGLILLAAGALLLRSLYLRQPSSQLMQTTIEPTASFRPAAAPPNPQTLQLVEAAFPDFVNFTEQPTYGGKPIETFAGQSVDSFQIGNDEYLIFTIHGSGVPIIKATCFRISQDRFAYKVGEFPQMTDSYSGYRLIDPTTCNVIK